jgi:hypothetical protein
MPPTPRCQCTIILFPSSASSSLYQLLLSFLLSRLSVPPRRKVLPLSGRVREAGLAPSSLLNFRATGNEFANMPFLSDNMLRRTQAMQQGTF